MWIFARDSWFRVQGCAADMTEPTISIKGANGEEASYEQIIQKIRGAPRTYWRIHPDRLTARAKDVPPPHVKSYRKDYKHCGITELVASIKEHGILRPITVDVKLNIIDGMARWQAARELKMKWIPFVMLDMTWTGAGWGW